MKYSELDKWFPPRGECGLCGHEDARHRLWDSLINSPETDKTTALMFGVSVGAVKAVRKIRPYQ